MGPKSLEKPYIIQKTQFLFPLTFSKYLSEKKAMEMVYFNLGLQITVKFIFLEFSWNFRVLWGVLKKT